jgi:hypothetical protein
VNIGRKLYDSSHTRERLTPWLSSTTNPTVFINVDNRSMIGY